MTRPAPRHRVRRRRRAAAAARVGFRRRSWVSGVLLGLALLVVGAPAAVGGAQASSSPSSTAAPAVPGGWGWPLPGWARVTRPFHLGAHRWDPGHRGVDLAGQPGERVLAAAGGVVAFSAVLAGRGVLVVDHGAVRTTYEPVRAGSPVGTRVRRGDAVALLAAGHTGCPVVACLHWGMLRGRDYLDPLTAVRARLRLLPVGPHGEILGADSAPGVVVAGVAPERPGVSAAPAVAPGRLPGGGGRRGAGPLGLGGLAVGATAAAALMRRRW